jgi:hypothetical protein
VTRSVGYDWRRWFARLATAPLELIVADQVIVRAVRGDNVATEIVWRAISVMSAGPLAFPRCGSGIVRIRSLGLNKTRLDVRAHTF